MSAHDIRTRGQARELDTRAVVLGIAETRTEACLLLSGRLCRQPQLAGGVLLSANQLIATGVTTRTMARAPAPKVRPIVIRRPASHRILDERGCGPRK